MEKAVIYAKAKTSFGIRLQINKAQRYAKKHNLDVIAIHSDYDLQTVDTNALPELIKMQSRAFDERFNYLLVLRKTIISRDVVRLVTVESYLDRMGIKILSISHREL